MNHITYQVITTLKKTEKSLVMLAMMEGQEAPVIIKRMKTANPEIYQALSKLNNVYIPRIYAIESLEDELIIAEEYVDGETLEFHLNEKNFGKEEEKLELALQLCEAVKVLHNATPQIIHRDIKPSNILITEEGILKLIDFDASRQYKEMSNDSDTRILGTADFAAPEQFGYKQTDVRSDIYSLGIVFGLMDFHGKGIATLVWKHIIDVCTRFDPKKRFQNIESLVKHIQRVRTLQKHQGFYLCGLLCIVAMIGGGIWSNVDSSEDLEMSTIEAPSSEDMSEDMTETIQESTQNEQTNSIIIDTTQEQLQQIEQQLKEDSAYVEFYHQGVNKGEKLLIYSTFFESAVDVESVSLKDLATGKNEYLSPDAYGFQEAIFYLEPDFLQTLQSTYYRIELEFIEEGGGVGVSMEGHIRVYSSEEPFEEGPYVLANNYLDYCYKENEKIHTILRLDNHVKLSAVCTQFGVPFPAEQYQILYDGKGVAFSAELLERCKNQKETTFLIEFDDGRQEFLTIANPYIR